MPVGVMVTLRGDKMWVSRKIYYIYSSKGKRFSRVRD